MKAKSTPLEMHTHLMDSPFKVLPIVSGVRDLNLYPCLFLCRLVFLNFLYEMETKLALHS